MKREEITAFITRLKSEGHGFLVVVDVEDDQGMLAMSDSEQHDSPIEETIINIMEEEEYFASFMLGIVSHFSLHKLAHHLEFQKAKSKGYTS